MKTTVKREQPRQPEVRPKAKREEKPAVRRQQRKQNFTAGQSFSIAGDLSQ